MAIRKIDYYVGAILSYLIEKCITPAIFDSTDESKIIVFETDEDKYNLFVKYSGKPVKSQDGYSRWAINFSMSEMSKIDTYQKDGYKNLIVLVCSTESLTKTEIVVIDLKDAKKCLGDDTVNTNKRISVRKDKGSRYLKCYGTALTDKDAIQIKRNIDNYF